MLFRSHKQPVYLLTSGRLNTTSRNNQDPYGDNDLRGDKRDGDYFRDYSGFLSPPIPRPYIESGIESEIESGIESESRSGSGPGDWWG